MIFLGFILVAAGAVFGLDLLWKNSYRLHTIDVFGQSLGVSSTRWLFLVGVIVGAAIVLGVILLIAGLGRKGAKAVSTHKGHRQNRQERQDLEARNEDLRNRLQVLEAREQPGVPGDAGGASVPTAGRTVEAGHSPLRDPMP